MPPTAYGTQAQNQHPMLDGIGHGLADWIIGVGKAIGHFFTGNMVGALVAGLALYVIFAPDLAGTSRA